MNDNNRSGWRLNCSVAGEHYKAFLPRPLPPVPSLALDEALYDLMEKANQALGRLDGITNRFPEVISIPGAARELGLSEPTVTSSLKQLETLGIVRELTGSRRHRRFVYDKYLSLLSEGTEPFQAGE